MVRTRVDKELEMLRKEIKLTRKDIKKIRKMLEYNRDEADTTYIG